MNFTQTEMIAISNALGKQIVSQVMELANSKENPIVVSNVTRSTEFLKELKDRIDTEWVS